MPEPLLYEVLFAWKCTSTHHKFALDALRHLQHEQAEAWKNLFLANVETYLTGSKAPDNQFKDFKNHVLHVEDNLWGGAVGSTIAWYAKSLAALQQKKWREAIYNIGVMSHYFTDPWQPFHTGQSEAENVVHRAAEWSIACAYNELQDILIQDQGGYPQVSLPTGDDWLSQLVIHGARTAHPHYQASIDHYNLKKGVKDPPQGLDQEIKDRLAKIIGEVVVSLARVMDRLFTEAAVVPPNSSISMLGVMSQLTVPIFWVTKKMKNAKDRAVVQAMYNEYQKTGKVLQTLPEDDKTVRTLYAEEVLQLPLEMLDEEPTGPIGQAHGTGAPERSRTKTTTKKVSPKLKPQAAKPASTSVEEAELVFYCEPAQPVEKAPSIGPKTAGQLERAGIHTVADLIAAQAETLAAKLANRHFDREIIQEWQQQAVLVCSIPKLRGGDAQLLTGCGITDAKMLAEQTTNDLFGKIKAFAATAAGERILRGGKIPIKDEIAQWIQAAQQTLSRVAA